MKKLIVIGLTGFGFITSHILTLQAAPILIMKKAMTIMAERGVPLHGFSLSPRITPSTQTIVRASPDLAYSLCLFDLSAGPIVIKGAKWDGYGSLTIFNNVTDVIHIASLNISSGDTGGAILSLDKDKIAREGLPVITLKSPKGIALIRRLAPTPYLYKQAKTLSNMDICASLAGSSNN